MKKILLLLLSLFLGLSSQAQEDSLQANRYVCLLYTSDAADE